MRLARAAMLLSLATASALSVATGANAAIAAKVRTAPVHEPLQITIANYAFAPETATATVGQTVVWTNRDDAPHDATSTSGPTAFAGPTLHRGQSWHWLARVPGVYRYICSVHPDMHATLVVRPVPSTSSAAPMPERTRRATAPIVRRPVVNRLGPVTASASGRTAVDPSLLISGVAVGATAFCLLLLLSGRRSG